MFGNGGDTGREGDGLDFAPHHPRTHTARLRGNRGDPPDRLVGIRAGHDDEQFLATVAAGNVRCPQSVEQCLGDPEQHDVAGLVSPLVIEALEMIKVDHHHRQRFFLAQGAMDFPRQRLVEVTPVEQAGQRITNRLLEQFLGALAHLVLEPAVQRAQTLGHGITPLIRSRQDEGTGEKRAHEQQRDQYPAAETAICHPHQHVRGNPRHHLPDVLVGPDRRRLAGIRQRRTGCRGHSGPQRTHGDERPQSVAILELPACAR